MNINVDFLTPTGGQGLVAQRFNAERRLDPGMMRPWIGDDGRVYVTVYKGSGDPGKPDNYQVIPIQTNATLRRDEWKQLDDAVLEVSLQRLGGIQDLRDKGLIYTLGNAMGTTVLEHHTMSDAMEADLTMDGVTRSQGDRPNFETVYMPIPIIHVDYEIGARALEASRKLGNPLDTIGAAQAARKCNEKLEDMLFTSTSYAFGGGTIYSYLNHPSRNTGTLTGAWTGLTGAQIITDVTEMKQASLDAHHYGPWMLYIPTAYETTLDKDYDATTPGTTIRERILKIAGIQGVKVIDRMTTANVVLAQMTSDVVRLVVGFGLQNVQWSVEGNMINKNKVMTIQVPQVRADQSGNSGIVHYTV